MKIILSILTILILLASCTSQEILYKNNDINEGNETLSTVLPTLPEGSTFEIDYLNVGQADCAFIQCDGFNMLIDGGNAADSDLVVSFQKEEYIGNKLYAVHTRS